MGGDGHRRGQLRRSGPMCDEDAYHRTARAAIASAVTLLRSVEMSLLPESPMPKITEMSALVPVCWRSR